MFISSLHFRRFALFWSLNLLLGYVAMLRLNDQGFRFSSPADTRYFSVLQSTRNGSVVHVASYQVNIVRAFSGGRATRKVVWGMKPEGSPTWWKLCSLIYFTAKSLYMSRVSQHPSSGVLKTVTAASGIGRTVKYKDWLELTNKFCVVVSFW